MPFCLPVPSPHVEVVGSRITHAQTACPTLMLDVQCTNMPNSLLIRAVGVWRVRCVCKCARRVASYFTTLCYEVGGDVLSMADLEHCVLRAKTSQPKQVDI